MNATGVRRPQTMQRRGRGVSPLSGAGWLCRTDVTTAV